jgi:hypothetical protein
MMSLIVSALASIFVVTSAQASPCKLSKTAKLNCELKWSEGRDQYRLQLITESENCTARSPDSDMCANFRLCKGNEIAGIGAASIAAPSGSPAYCLSDKPIDLFVSDQHPGPRAFIECDNGKPLHVRMMAPNQIQSLVAKSQVCKFPLWTVTKKVKKAKQL